VKIRLIPANNIQTIIPLLRELDPTINSTTLSKRLDDMVRNGYECAGIFSDNKLIGICGIWTLYKYYVGKHLEPDNVYIQPKYQSSGVGSLLTDWLVNLAKTRDCEAIELNCYQGNIRGNEFWVKNNFKLLGNHYQLKI